jgi:ornithine decarboxylase
MVECTKSTTLEAIREIIYNSNNEDPFYVMNQDVLKEQVNRWSWRLPSVKPFYAVKCNPNARLLNLMKTKYNMGFECASYGEVRLVLESGGTVQDIIYCNPCRQLNHLIKAYALGVRIMSFDNHEELNKIAKNCPDAKLLLRILVDDSDSVCRLGSKFGANELMAKDLLVQAKLMNANVCGISYHVGSNCLLPTAYTKALIESQKMLNEAAYLGFNMEILDIGGGFPARPQFEDIAEEISQRLELLAIDFPNLSVIAEPGRYFAEPVFTLATQVISRKVDNGILMYYINDGVYGSFNCIIFDYATVEPIPVNEKNEEPTIQSCIWGPTCDSLDCVVKTCQLPPLEIGDWIYFENMGAYTMAASSTFNGFEIAQIFYIGSND